MNKSIVARISLLPVVWPSMSILWEDFLSFFFLILFYQRSFWNCTCDIVISSKWNRKTFETIIKSLISSCNWLNNQITSKHGCFKNLKFQKRKKKLTLRNFLGILCFFLLLGYPKSVSEKLINNVQFYFSI